MPHYITQLLSSSSPSKYTTENIEALLNTAQTTLEHGATFTGRPTTRIHCSQYHVLKLHNELNFNALSSQRWIEQIVEKERRYQVYHPDKTWFACHDATQNRYIIGNITPRLQPLHTIFEQTDINIEEALQCFTGLFKLYFKVAKQHNLRLDEGLSNFAIDTQKANQQQPLIIYYLDDDTYLWDKHVMLSQMLGVYLRRLPWIQGETASKLGHIIRAEIQTLYDDNQNAVVLSEQLRGLFLNTEQQQSLKLLRAALVNDCPKTTTSALNLIKSERYIAILADIHANLPALETVLAWLKTNNIKAAVVLGDLVGYGPHPQACLQRLAAYDFIFLKGNHDNALATGNFKKGLSSNATWVLNWSNTRISDTDKTYLANLISVLYHDDWMAVHGAPIDPTFFNAYVYQMTFEQNLDHLAKKDIKICFHGHSHLPGVYGRRRNRIDEYYLEDEIDLEPFSQCLVCPGSIGQPRNKQAQIAQFAIFDQQTQSIAFQSLPYDAQQVLDDMKAENFPSSLIRLLEKG